MIDQNGKKTRIHVANPNIDLGEGIHDDDELGGLRNKSRGSNIMQFINHSKFKFRTTNLIKCAKTLVTEHCSSDVDT